MRTNCQYNGWKWKRMMKVQEICWRKEAKQMDEFEDRLMSIEQKLDIIQIQSNEIVREILSDFKERDEEEQKLINEKNDMILETLEEIKELSKIAVANQLLEAIAIK